MLAIEERPNGITFKVYVQPRSSKNSIAGIYGEAIKLKLTAPPVNDAANNLCIKYLAKCLGVSNSSLEIISGHTSRSKKILFRYQGKNLSKNSLKHLKRQIESLVSSKNLS
jgi:uncharacterized protein (TIGR00251 family)